MTAMRRLAPFFALLLLGASPWGLNSDDYLSPDVIGTAPNGTGITVVALGARRPGVFKVTVARTALTAAALTQDVTIWTVPAKTRVQRLVVDTTAGFTGGTVASMTVGCGPAAGSVAYLLAGSVFTTGQLGLAVATIGAGLLSASLADVPNWSATTAVICRFTAVGGNLSTLTAGSATFYLEVVPYP